jgi:hypothetical protein
MVCILFLLLYSRQHNSLQIKNNSTVCYSVFATCFDPAGSSSGSFHEASLVVGFCPNMDIDVSNFIDIKYPKNIRMPVVVVLN